MFQSRGSRETEADQSETQATKLGGAVETESDEVQCFPDKPQVADTYNQNVES